MKNSNSKPKILIIGPCRAGKIGGIATHIKNLSNSEIALVDYDLHQFDLKPEKNQVKEYISVWKQFIFSCRNYNLLYLNVSNSGSLYRKSIAAVLSRIMGQRNVVSHIHGSGFESNISNSLRQRLAFKILGYCSKEIVVLHYFGKSVLARYTKTKISVIHNSSRDFSKTFFEIPVFNEQICNLTNSGKNFALFVGEVSKRKGIEDLIEVWSDIFKQTNYHLLIAGNYPSDPRQFVYLDDTKISHSGIHYLGSIRNDLLPYLMVKCKFLVLPSYAEGQPISLIEGLSLSVPFVATNLAGIVEIDPSNQFSYMSEPGNRIEFKGAVLGIIGKIELNQIDFKAIRDAWENHFSPEVTIKQLTSLFGFILLSKP